jgi:hypothetical protein
MLEPGIAHVRDTVMPAMTHIAGFVGLSLMVDRASGRCIATSAWSTERDLRDSAQRAATIRQSAAGAFGGPTAADEWEVKFHTLARIEDFPSF